MDAVTFAKQIWEAFLGLPFDTKIMILILQWPVRWVLTVIWHQIIVRIPFIQDLSFMLSMVDFQSGAGLDHITGVAGMGTFIITAPIYLLTGTMQIAVINSFKLRQLRFRHKIGITAITLRHVGMPPMN